MSPLPEFNVEPSGELNDELLQASLDTFTSDGAWLLLSMFLYGWRSHYDLAVSLATGTKPHPASDGRPNDPELEFEIVRDLHVQGLIFAAAEHYLGLVYAARQHLDGTGAFFDAYVSLPPISKLAVDLGDVTTEEIGNLVGAPADSDDVATELADHLRASEGNDLVLGLAETPTTEIGGLHLPTSFVDRELCDRMLASALELVDLMTRNVHELRAQLLEPAKVEIERAPLPQPLREIDNSYRHGQRVFFHRAVPEARRFRGLGEAPRPSLYFVDLYLPRGNDTVKYGSVDCSPDRTREHLEALRHICIRIGQFTRAFIGHQALRHSQLLLGASQLDLPAPPAPV